MLCLAYPVDSLGKGGWSRRAKQNGITLYFPCGVHVMREIGQQKQYETSDVCKGHEQVSHLHFNLRYDCYGHSHEATRFHTPDPIFLCKPFADAETKEKNKNTETKVH